MVEKTLVSVGTSTHPRPSSKTTTRFRTVRYQEVL
jgi:hypothetical protein